VTLKIYAQCTKFNNSFKMIKGKTKISQNISKIRTKLSLQSKIIERRLPSKGKLI